MTVTEPGPRLTTPTGGAMTLPSSPAQWHGHPYVWSWYVSLAALDSTFIEARCKEAAQEDAPPDAVYKTSLREPTEPDTWITVDQLGDRDRDRVQDYGRALLKWEADLAEFRRQNRVRPLQQTQPASTDPQPAPATDTAGSQHRTQ